MTISLPSLLSRVRSSVAEITVDNMDDLTMYRSVQKANTYITSLKRDDATDDDTATAIVCLSAYYAHTTYTLLNARQLGTIDESVVIRGQELKKIARATLLVVSKAKLDANLAVDDKRYQQLGGIGFAITESALADTSRFMV